MKPLILTRKLTSNSDLQKMRSSDNKGTMRITMVSGNFDETLQIFPDSVKRLRSMTQSKSNYNLLYNLGDMLNSSSWSNQPMNKFQDYLEKHKLQYKHSYYGLYQD